MPQRSQGYRGYRKLIAYQPLWNPETSLGKFYFTDFTNTRRVTPEMNAENFARVIDILRNEKPVYGEAITGAVTTEKETIGEEES